MDYNIKDLFSYPVFMNNARKSHHIHMFTALVTQFSKNDNVIGQEERTFCRGNGDSAVENRLMDTVGEGG